MQKRSVSGSAKVLRLTLIGKTSSNLSSPQSKDHSVSVVRHPSCAWLLPKALLPNTVSWWTASTGHASFAGTWVFSPHALEAPQWGDSTPAVCSSDNPGTKVLKVCSWGASYSDPLEAWPFLIAGAQQGPLRTLSLWIKTQETLTQERTALSDWVALPPMSPSLLTVLTVTLFQGFGCQSCPVYPCSNNEAGVLGGHRERLQRKSAAYKLELCSITASHMHGAPSLGTTAVSCPFSLWSPLPSTLHLSGAKAQVSKDLASHYLNLLNGVSSGKECI